MSQLKNATIVLGVVGACASACGQSSRATYELSFQSLWSQPTHPTAFVSSAHFSLLVGGVHSDQVSFWEPGGIASPGIEIMAETGSRNTLRNEVNAAIGAGSARSLVLGGAVDTFPDTTTVTFEATANGLLSHDRLTLVSMIAPSPDWFVGTHGLELRDANGDWIDEIVIDLDAYDAGTDSGPDLTSPNADTNPQEPIRNIQNEPPFTGLPVLARYTITLVDVAECLADTNSDGELSPADFNAWILAFNQQDDMADQNDDGLISPADFNAWIINYNGGC